MKSLKIISLFKNSRRKPLRVIIAVSVILVLLAIIFTFVPSIIARSVISNKLDELGVEYDGIDTVKVNIWQGKAWVGPITIRRGDSDPGKVVDFGVKMSLLSLLTKKTLAQRVLIRGIDIAITHSKEEIIELNGIPLNQFFPDHEDDKESRSWKFGLSDLELTDSRILFFNKDGGVLMVEIEMLEMEEFKEWNPDQPGKFRLKASVNDIPINWTGEARPFADNITLSIDADSKNINLDKIIRFIGPIGWERKNGIYNSSLKHKIKLFPSGKIEGETSGMVELTGVDYKNKDNFELSVKQSRINLDTKFIWDEHKDFLIEGNFALIAHKVKGDILNDNNYYAESADVKLEGVKLEVGSDKSVKIDTETQIALKKAGFSGKIEISVFTLLNILNFVQSLSAKEPIKKEKIGLEFWSENKLKIKKSDISADQLNSSYKLGLSTIAGNISLDLAGSTELSDLEIANKEQKTTIKYLRKSLEALEVKTEGNSLSLQLKGNTDSDNWHIKDQNGYMNSKKIQTELKNIFLTTNPGEVSFDASASAEIIETELNIDKKNELSEAVLGTERINAVIDLGLLISSENPLEWNTKLDAGLDNLSLEIAKGEEASAKLKRIELKKVKADHNLNLSGKDFKVSGLEMFITSRLIANILKNIKRDKSADSDSGVETTDRDDKLSSVKKIQWRLIKLGYDPGPIDGKMGPRTLGAIRDLEKSSGTSLEELGNEEMIKAMNKLLLKKVELKIDRVAIADGASIEFFDDQVEPLFKIDTFIKTFEINQINTTDLGKKAQINISADVNDFTEIEINGWASALGPEANLELTCNINNLELHPYSPYTAEYGGFYLDSGQLTSLLDASAKQGNLDGSIKIDIEGIDITKIDDEKFSSKSTRFGFSINTVISLLENKEGRIELTLPVKGTLTEPGVSLKPAVMKGIGGAFKKIFPPNILISMISVGDDGSMTFQPIIFSPGSVKLNRDAKRYANNLLELLNEEPKLSIDVCGHATIEDLAKKAGLKIKNTSNPEHSQDGHEKVLKIEPSADLQSVIEKYRPEMNELALERTSRVRNYLIEKKGADPERVAECQPGFDPDDQRPPRVEISL